MRKNPLIILIAVATITSLTGSVQAQHLAAPTDLTCPLVEDVIEANWVAVSGATKYSLNIIATYPTGTADPSGDTTVDFDFGTGDRIDGDAPYLNIPLSALTMIFG